MVGPKAQSPARLPGHAPHSPLDVFWGMFFNLLATFHIEVPISIEFSFKNF